MQVPVVDPAMAHVPFPPAGSCSASRCWASIRSAKSTRSSSSFTRCAQASRSATRCDEFLGLRTRRRRSAPRSGAPRRARSARASCRAGPHRSPAMDANSPPSVMWPQFLGNCSTSRRCARSRSVKSSRSSSSATRCCDASRSRTRSRSSSICCSSSWLAARPSSRRAIARAIGIQHERSPTTTAMPIEADHLRRQHHPGRQHLDFRNGRDRGIGGISGTCTVTVVPCRRSIMAVSLPLAAAPAPRAGRAGAPRNRDAPPARRPGAAARRHRRAAAAVR